MRMSPDTEITDDEWYSLDSNEQVRFILARWENPEKDRLVARFLSEHMTIIRRRAQKEARLADVERGEFGELVEDLVQEFVVLILSMLQQEFDDPGPTHVGAGQTRHHGYSETGSSWESVFAMKAHNVARSYVDQKGGRNLAGASGALRRRRFLETSRERFRAEFGREPDTAELREYAAARASKRADPRRQGMVFASTDGDSKRRAVEIPNPVISHTPASDILQEIDGTDEPQYVSVEGRDLARHVVTEAADRSRLLGEVAVAWLSPILSGRTGDPTEWDEVASTMGLDANQVASARASLGECLRSVLAETRLTA